MLYWVKEDTQKESHILFSVKVDPWMGIHHFQSRGEMGSDPWRCIVSFWSNENVVELNRGEEWAVAHLNMFNFMFCELLFQNGSKTPRYKKSQLYLKATQEPTQIFQNYDLKMVGNRKKILGVTV